MLDSAFLLRHRQLTRRYFLGLAAVGAALLVRPSFGQGADPKPSKPEKAGAKLEPYFTPAADFRDVSRGKPVPHSLPDEKKREVGLTRDTWRLEVIADPDHPAKLGRTFTQADNTAFDFAALLELGKQHAVRFPKIMTCLNLGCPLGMGLWEGVPLRELILLTKPREKLRRVFYYGYHNDDPKQMFRSSLPIGRVLEDPFDLPPVILCYKLNGEWLDAERGGPVRIVVPEAYGFKSIKWLTHVVLTNLAYANDTYAEQDNDVDSPLKTFAATLSFPDPGKAGEPIALSGYAQVGISGLSKVQVWIEPSDTEHAEGDPNFTQAPWQDAQLLAPPAKWDALPDDKLPAETHGVIDGKPRTWPLRLTKAHWAAVLPGLPKGTYTLRCRSIDEKGLAQPLPRPLRKSGHAAIEAITFDVK
ncbi:molybdopterin-dependent oxidoreductase [Anatilimnocola sp. NA78]|uniref:molybdopterin-dependent oxidoreductase n=1 Tax=Anatilimnocola sp. NA78 TaxID=3415683 RepID=UPI003CE47D5A